MPVRPGGDDALKICLAVSIQAAGRQNKPGRHRDRVVQVHGRVNRRRRIGDGHDCDFVHHRSANKAAGARHERTAGERRHQGRVDTRVQPVVRCLAAHIVDVALDLFGAGHPAIPEKAPELFARQVPPFQLLWGLSSVKREAVQHDDATALPACGRVRAHRISPGRMAHEQRLAQAQRCNQHFDIAPILLRPGGLCRCLAMAAHVKRNHPEATTQRLRQRTPDLQVVTGAVHKEQIRPAPAEVTNREGPGVGVDEFRLDGHVLFPWRPLCANKTLARCLTSPVLHPWRCARTCPSVATGGPANPARRRRTSADDPAARIRFRHPWHSRSRA
ncbi:MAG: hypothetical protein BWX79_02861 [Alphaproteobacteria bacterium ADurb.Bin100]|nr:MAG: hypothetical protein BWX79_02861 [Alphaproteobacteria bacterium ADurb.Bin100]